MVIKKKKKDKNMIGSMMFYLIVLILPLANEKFRDED